MTNRYTLFNEMSSERMSQRMRSGSVRNACISPRPDNHLLKRRAGQRARGDAHALGRDVHAGLAREASAVQHHRVEADDLVLGLGV